MKLIDAINVLDSSMKLIIEDQFGTIIYMGYKGLIIWDGDRSGMRALNLTGEEKVESIRAYPDIRAKDWKERNLDKPLEPDAAPQWMFADLQMSLYYKIKIDK